jgi:hypothetical protein
MNNKRKRSLALGALRGTSFLAAGKTGKAVSVFLLLALLAACGGSGSSGGSSNGGSPSGSSSNGSGGSSNGGGGGTQTPSSTNNVMALTVNGSLCSPATSASYPNKPCVSVTICAPGTTNCQTINDILLDTGSYGLRVFQSVLTVPLSPIKTSSGAQIAECIEYLDNASDWGPIELASVVLGGEPAVQIPVHVINSGFFPSAAANDAGCTNLDTSPSEAGFNGILGVGPYAQDCGSFCANYADNTYYYACSGSSCTPTAVTLSNQVQNPVSLLPQDNNGVLVELPALSGDSSASANGYLVLGIGTQSNNSPSAGTSVYVIDNNPIDSNYYMNISTTFQNTTYPSFIDTGSNGLFFDSSGLLPACSAPNSSWFCPQSLKTLSASNQGTGGSAISLSFGVGNFDSIISSSSEVSAEVGGGSVSSTPQFDWGLPFFFGRSVYVGLEGTKSVLGTGPYWAY